MVVVVKFYAGLVPGAPRRRPDEKQNARQIQPCLQMLMYREQGRISMECEWEEYRKTLNLTPEEENAIELEKSHIIAVVEARKKSGLKQKQSSDLCGVNQSAVAG